MSRAINPPEKHGADASHTPLNAERIVGEAIILMQEQGLDAVSLRRLAGRLGVQAMSIYWHIPNKEELLRRMTKRLYVQAMADMPVCATWQDWARAHGRALWTMYHTVRDAARLTFSLGLIEDDFRNFRAHLAERLQPLGLSAVEAVQLHSAIQALVIGWAGFDITYGEAMGKLTPIEPAVMDSLEALIVGSECLRNR